MLKRGLCAILLAAACAGPVFAIDETVTAVDFKDLPAWEQDDHRAAFDAFLKSCNQPKGKLVPKDLLKSLCEFAQSGPDPKVFFQLMFQPVLVGADRDTVFTGYYEPTIKGSRTRTGKFQTPLYRKPPELKPGKRWKTRGEIQAGALRGRGLEIVWLEDPVEAYFLQIQGSGRIELPDGGAVRLGFAAKNGYKYRSAGLEMVRKGYLSNASAKRIKQFVQKNPKTGRRMLAHNKSYVFFRELKSLGPNDGPLGAMGVSVTAERSLAVDPRFNPLGLPVYIDKRGDAPMQRLMIAQDVGAAIKGAQRADIFYGSGATAGKIASNTKASGRMYLLLPIDIAAKYLDKK